MISGKEKSIEIRRIGWALFNFGTLMVITTVLITATIGNEIPNLKLRYSFKFIQRIRTVKSFLSFLCVNSEDNQVGICFLFFFLLWSQRNEKGGGPVVTQVSCRNKNGLRSQGHVPFKAYSVFPPGMAVGKEDKEEFPIHGLSLCTPGIKNPTEESASSGGSRSSGTRAVSSSTLTASANLRTGLQQHQHQHQHQSSRKQRRCWSPELHRRFVSALQQLGGSQGKKWSWC